MASQEDGETAARQVGERANSTAASTEEFEKENPLFVDEDPLHHHGMDGNR